MRRLLYISSSSDARDDATLESILRVSRRNNAAVAVTGLLVVGGKRFLQALEGPEDAVEQVFARIAQDPRHRAVVMLSRKTIERRMFGDWAMGYRAARSKHGDAAPLPQIVAELVETIDDASLRAEFMSFATLHAAA